MKFDRAILRDPGYRGALHIFTSPTFRRDDARLWSHVKLTSMSDSKIDFVAILRGNWSSTEALMLRAAWPLFNQDYDVNLKDLVHRLSDSQVRTLIHAITCAAFQQFVPPDGLLHEKVCGTSPE